MLGCKNCMQVYYLCDLASVPAADRVTRFEEMEEIIHKLVEAEKKGFEFIADRHAKITYEE